MLSGTVDRSLENSAEDSQVSVKLENGYELRFFITGMTDEEYIKRTNKIYQISQNKFNNQTQK